MIALALDHLAWPRSASASWPCKVLSLSARVFVPCSARDLQAALPGPSLTRNEVKLRAQLDPAQLLLMFHGDPKGPSSKLLAAVREQGDDAVLRGDCRCARRVRRRRGGRVTGSPASWPGPSCVLRSPGRRPGPPRSFWPRPGPPAHRAERSSVSRKPDLPLTRGGWPHRCVARMIDKQPR